MNEIVPSYCYTVRPRSTILNRDQAEIELQFTRIKKQFFALKLT